MSVCVCLFFPFWVFRSDGVTNTANFDKNFKDSPVSFLAAKLDGFRERGVPKHNLPSLKLYFCGAVGEIEK